jgi:thioredoxin-like negative regulator of GroEL
MTITRERFGQADTYDQFREEAKKHEALWRGIYEHMHLSEEVTSRLLELPGKRNVVVLAEDWCGDAASLVPILAKVADAAPDRIDLRVLSRDENLDVMDCFLSHGGRSIPVAIILDEDMQLLGWWGPRPAPAQAMFRQLIRDFKAGVLKDKSADVFHPILKWYREDRGRHTIDEFLMILERGGESRP